MEEVCQEARTGKRAIKVVQRAARTSRGYTRFDVINVWTWFPTCALPVQYMFPEQAAGRPVDYHSDQFSLGSILYEMATGKLAYQRDTGPETQAAKATTTEMRMKKCVWDFMAGPSFVREYIDARPTSRMARPARSRGG